MEKRWKCLTKFRKIGNFKIEFGPRNMSEIDKIMSESEFNSVFCVTLGPQNFVSQFSPYSMIQKRFIIQKHCKILILTLFCWFEINLVIKIQFWNFQFSEIFVDFFIFFNFGSSFLAYFWLFFDHFCLFFIKIDCFE